MYEFIDNLFVLTSIISLVATVVLYVAYSIVQGVKHARLRNLSRKH